MFGGRIFVMQYAIRIAAAAQIDVEMAFDPAEAAPGDMVTFSASLTNASEETVVADFEFSMSFDEHAFGPVVMRLAVCGGKDVQIELPLVIPAHMCAGELALSVTVTVDPAVDVQVTVSGDRKFLTVVPLEPYMAGADDKVSLRIQGDYLEDFDREGLKFPGGSKAGDFDQTFDFGLSAPGATELPLPIPATPGDPAGVWEFYRLAAPLPTILPSYNQIGFDSLHYLIGVVEPGLAWVIGALPVEGEDRAEVDPATGVAFPMQMRYEGGDLSLTNDAGFALEVMALELELSSFRIAARLDASGGAVGPARVAAGGR